MAEVSNKQVILRDYVSGFPKESDMEIRSSNMIKLKLPEGSKGVLVKNLYLSCDPYMRGRMNKNVASYAQPFNPGSVSLGFFIFFIICLIFSYFVYVQR